MLIPTLQQSGAKKVREEHRYAQQQPRGFIMPITFQQGEGYGHQWNQGNGVVTLMVHNEQR